MTARPFLLAAMLTLAACAQFPDSPALRALQPEAGAHAMLGEIARVAGLTAEQRRRELAALEGNRLDDARRFLLAALLEREDSVEALERGVRALNAIDASDPRAQAAVELLKRSLRARIDLKLQTARAQELQDRLEQIKTLEKSLQQRPAAKP